MTPTPSQDEIILKLRKLMALKERAATEAEAANAAEKIAAILQKHNLEIGVLDKVDEQKGVQGDAIELSAKFQPYDALLAQCADVMMDTRHFITYTGHYKTKNGKRGAFIRTSNLLIFVGLKANVEAATSIYRFLRESVEFMLNERWVKGYVKGQTECRDYRLGASRKILQMCAEIKRKRKETAEAQNSIEGQQCTALVLVGNAVAQNYLNEVVKPTGQCNVNFSHKSRHAYALGVQDGATVDPFGAHKSLEAGK